MSVWEHLFSAASVIETCPAKLNLFLHVTGKRPDGYHNLQSWVAFTELVDTITIRESKAAFFLASGPFAKGLPPPQENLITKTIQLMSDRHKKKNAKLYVELTKNLPIGSGLGGGSADVGGLLRGLQKLWGFEWFADDAAWLAKNLGADVPVCLTGQSCIVSGIGERLKLTPPLPPECHVVVVFPSIPVHTKEVFEMIVPPYTPPAPVKVRCADVVDLVQALQPTRNDLMQAAMSQQHTIIKAYRTIVGQQGCLMTRMSGSGSTCFGIFADAETAQAAARTIAAAEPTWWVRQSRLLSAPLAA